MKKILTFLYVALISSSSFASVIIHLKNVKNDKKNFHFILQISKTKKAAELKPMAIDENKNFIRPER